MSESNSAQQALERALKRRKELSDTIRSSLQEIDKIEEMLKMFRVYSASSPEGGMKDVELEPPGLGRAGRGLTQPMFEHLVREILRARGEPMQSADFVEEFRKRGHPIGGTNESKQAWNRLWQAKLNGLLVHFPKPGYWLADEPIPESNAVKNKAAIDAGLMDKPETTRRVSHKYSGKPKGRPSSITDSQAETAKKWILEDKKTYRQVAFDLGGVSLSSLRYKLRDFVKEQRNKRRAEKTARASRQPGKLIRKVPTAKKPSKR